ncbi:unnamed protein product [Nesidiocoris tenuis]|uniref:Uncharacterized protein n=1 Tax=Nesidiocoris tenuis TaxID=355587 RepID=A0A6H5GZP1_9HEMI|nr:unnamed protein product [Nesidiocoris tenuis]
MTYMYEYPQLVRISLPANVTNTYPKYGLYAYGEGRLIQKIRSMRFTGIPVLFIPGNRGSPNQGRSYRERAISREQFQSRQGQGDRDIGDAAQSYRPSGHLPQRILLQGQLLLGHIPEGQYDRRHRRRRSARPSRHVGPDVISAR